MPYSEYRPDLMGHAWLDRQGAIEAGSMQELVLTYKAGQFGIDDTGSIKIGFRFATDFGPVQFSDPQAPGYTTVEASNGGKLTCKWEFKRNIRPWSRSLYIGLAGHFLSPGETITVRFGDRRQGAPGIRMQTYCEDDFEFRVFVDAFATYDYVALPDSPRLRIVPGAPVHWHAVVPSIVGPNQPFALKIKAEDRWRNPSDIVDRTVFLDGPAAIEGLPPSIRLPAGAFFCEVEVLASRTPGDYVITCRDSDGQTLCRSNPIRVRERPEWIYAWGDTHGQSNETLGTNSAERYFEFGRDVAFLDVIGHQGNDFQITDEFWDALNRTTRDFDVTGRFVCIPGYEWSANTAVGGDRNVHYLSEGEKIYRSSHAQVSGQGADQEDAYTAEELFSRLDPAKAVVMAHVGGRYADIVKAHDPVLETAVEVHSSWGTFEWILKDAFDQGLRVGIVANSDGHKGRPGACYPGASFFGSCGGLTCFLVDELSREGVFESMRARRHYATTGARILMDVRAEFEAPAKVYPGDPIATDWQGDTATDIQMGSIAFTNCGQVRLKVDVHGTAPIVGLDIFDGNQVLETLKPYSAPIGSRRIRIVYAGAACRGRARASLWEGSVAVSGNRINEASQINNWNLDRGLRSITAEGFRWSAVTTGNFGAVDLWLHHPDKGRIEIATPFVDAAIDLASLGEEEKSFDAGGLDRALRIFRLPEVMHEDAIKIERDIDIDKYGRRLYVRVHQEDGNVAWSSPIYIIMEDKNT